MKNKKANNTKNIAMLAGAATLAAFAPQVQAQSSDALIDKLVDKGILSVNEAKDLRNDADKDFKTAFSAKTGMPDWVTGYKFNGSFRGRWEQFSATENGAATDRTRFRYRLLLGATVSMQNDLEAGFRLGSGDQKAYGTSMFGNPVSQNSTIGNGWADRGIYIDTAYGKWSPINGGNWNLSTTVGKMENPFTFTWMVFDPDITPEGGVIQSSYNLNDNHALAFTGGAFALAEVAASTQDPFIYGGQLMLNSKWSDKWSSAVGGGFLAIVSPQQLGTAAPVNNTTAINTGNTLTGTGAPLYNLTPLIADASVTYTLDSFPLYPEAFPITLKGEGIHNPGAPKNNNGLWVGAIFGKSGKKKTWDLTYRYEYLEADAWYAQIVDDDNVAFAGTSNNAFNGGTNIKGHFVKFNYSFTDALMFSFSCYLNDMILHGGPSGAYAGNANDIHMFADVMWKF